jgi:hypothetical protein
MLDSDFGSEMEDDLDPNDQSDTASATNQNQLVLDNLEGDGTEESEGSHCESIDHHFDFDKGMILK